MEIKFVELLSQLKKVHFLLEDQDEIKKIMQMKVKEIIRPMEKMNLEDYEFLFLALMSVENRLCGESMKIFSRFWSNSTTDALRLENSLMKSIRHGDLKKYIHINDSDLYIYESEKENILAVILDEKDQASNDQNGP